METPQQAILDFLKAVDRGYFGAMPSGFNDSAFVAALRKQVANNAHECQPSTRRHKMPAGECPYCDSEKSSFHPPHDASKRCKSGKRSHCSCDTCF